MSGNVGAVFGWKDSLFNISCGKYTDKVLREKGYEEDLSFYLHSKTLSSAENHSTPSIPNLLLLHLVSWLWSCRNDLPFISAQIQKVHKHFFRDFLFCSFHNIPKEKLAFLIQKKPHRPCLIFPLSHAISLGCNVQYLIVTLCDPLFRALKNFNGGE